MEPEGPLSCSKETAINACPDPDESSPTPSHLPSLRSFNIRAILLSKFRSFKLLFPFKFSDQNPECTEYKLWSSSFLYLQ
jgi:hypothetical protein